MPWTVGDVNRFKKGLTAEQKEKWVVTANSTLSSYLKKGIDEDSAEIRAIRTANSKFGGNHKAINFEDFKQNGVSLTFGQVGVANEYQLVLPRGTMYSNKYGEIIFTRKFLQKMVDNQSALSNTKPFLNERHDGGRSLGWVEDMRVSDEGLEVKFDFTPEGDSLIKNGSYKYFSGEISGAIDINTGKGIFPVFMGCALTNRPVMKNMPEVHLEDVSSEFNGGNIVDFAEIMEAINAMNFAELSEDEKAEFVKSIEASGIMPKAVSSNADFEEQLVAKGEVIVSLKAKVTALSDELAKFEDEKIEKFLSECIEKGTLTPANKDKWKDRLSKDFEEYSEILSEMSPSVDLEEHGTGQGKETEAKEYKLEDFMPTIVSENEGEEE